MKLRAGRRQGRNLYLQIRDQAPSDDDVLVGQLDSPELAAFCIEAVTWYLERAERREPGAKDFTPTRSAFDVITGALVRRGKATP